jgi:hypothetical protein
VTATSIVACSHGPTAPEHNSAFFAPASPFAHQAAIGPCNWVPRSLVRISSGVVLTGVLPNWVEADPLRSRATDALGLQVIADRLADRLLPGLSVLTTRARYFTFLCWARARVGRDHDERGIHRWEVVLALAEATLSDDDPEHGERCAFVGSRKVKGIPHDRAPPDPRQVYKVPAWRAYRASMIALGLIQGAPRFSLTEVGAYAAKRFQAAVRARGTPIRPLPERACLSRVSGYERRLLRDLLGIAHRGPIGANVTDARTRRAAFAREVKWIFRRDRLSPETVLPRYEGLQAKRLDEPGATLRVAAIWERLSLGLNTLFTVWVQAIEAGRSEAAERKLARLLASRVPTGELADVDLTDHERALATAVASLRHAVHRHDDLAGRGVVLPGAEWFALARDLVGKRLPLRARVADTFERLLARHLVAKGDDAWVRRNGDVLELSREPGKGWTVPARVRLHAYRMSAFHSLAHDLGGY